MDYFIFAVLAAIKAEHTFAYPDVLGRFAGTFAGPFAQFAICTFALVFADSPEGKSANYAEEGSQRTNESAVEPRDDEVEQNRRQKYREYQPGSFVKATGY
jgi:hypothetical protein